MVNAIEGRVGNPNISCKIITKNAIGLWGGKIMLKGWIFLKKVTVRGDFNADFAGLKRWERLGN